MVIGEDNNSLKEPLLYSLLINPIVNSGIVEKQFFTDRCEYFIRHNIGKAYWHFTKHHSPPEYR